MAHHPKFCIKGKMQSILRIEQENGYYWSSDFVVFDDGTEIPLEVFLDRFVGSSSYLQEYIAFLPTIYREENGWLSPSITDPEFG